MDNTFEPELSRTQREVKELLEAFGYKPEPQFHQLDKGFVILKVPVKNGSESLPQRYKDAIAMLAKGYLSEIYYSSDCFYIWLSVDCLGIFPDDERYSCLVHELIHAKDRKPTDQGLEVFINFGDHFTRGFINTDTKISG